MDAEERMKNIGFWVTVVSLALTQAVPVSANEHASTIFSGGDIVTINDQQPTAEALAVKGDRILAVGNLADVLKLKGDSTRMVDLGGVRPGLGRDSPREAEQAVEFPKAKSVQFAFEDYAVRSLIVQMSVQWSE